MNDEKDPVAELIRSAGARPKVSDDVKARVHAAVHEEWQRDVAGRRRMRWVGGAIGLATAAGLATILVLRPSDAVRPPLPATATMIETAAASTRTMEWAGSSLRIDHGTRIRLESDRVASLESGAVYFSSEGAHGHVEIRTRFGTIRDIGTQFEVRLSDDRVRVRVREGSIDLRGNVATAGTEIVATQNAIERREIPRSGDAWAWVERAAPPIVIEGMTLDEVVHRVAREKGLDVEWKNSSAKGRRLHGRVPFSPDEALDAAGTAAGVRYTIENERLIVR